MKNKTLTLRMRLIAGPVWETTCNGVARTVLHSSGWVRVTYGVIVVHYQIDGEASKVSAWLDGVHTPCCENSPPDDGELLMTVGGYVGVASCVFDAPKT